MQRISRMKRELEILQQSPPPGVSCWLKDDSSLEHLEASIEGVDGTPFEKGLFKLEIQIPEKYPFQPPTVRFITKIYHPNIDDAGRICLDILKMPPKGGWKPSMNILSVLSSLRLLMNEPNPDDPLMTDISNEYLVNRTLFNQKARDYTRKFATNLSQAAPSDKRTWNEADESNSVETQKRLKGEESDDA